MQAPAKVVGWLIVMIIIVILPDTNIISAQEIAEPTRLKRLSLEQLMELEVTTASRKPQPYSSTAGAISVITQERIHRSGSTMLPDILRLAAGIHVIRSDARSWGVAARGFNLNTTNKLQVLMDGRILY